MAPRRRPGSLARLERALDERGIDPATFEAQVLGVLSDVERSPVADDPAAAFTADEARLLADGGLDLAPRRADEPDPRLATAAALAAIEADAATVADVAAALGVTRARVRQRILERSLHAIRVDGEWRLPRWQFEVDGRPVPGLAAVLAALPPDLHPVAARRFLLEPSPDLEVLGEAVAPLAWLRGGGSPAPVVAVAREL